MLLSTVFIDLISYLVQVSRQNCYIVLITYSFIQTNYTTYTETLLSTVFIEFNPVQVCKNQPTLNYTTYTETLLSTMFIEFTEV